MSLTQHGFSTQVFLNHGGAIEVEKQQFALHILILNSGGKTDQLPDVLVEHRVVRDRVLEVVELVLLRQLTVDGGDTYVWIAFYAGDTQVGVIFEGGTLNQVAEISDGDLMGCTQG